MVVPSGCIPVLVQTHGRVGSTSIERGNEITFEQDDEDVDKRGRGGRGFDGSFYFYNFNSSISDPAVFTPPTTCNSTMLAFDSEPIPDILEKFIDF